MIKPAPSPCPECGRRDMLLEQSQDKKIDIGKHQHCWHWVVGDTYLCCWCGDQKVVGPKPTSNHGRFKP